MNSKLEQKLAEYRALFTAEFDEKLSVIVKLWSEVRTSQELNTIKQFRFEVHSLKGSSGALNFLKLSDRLGMIEEEIAPCEERINSLKSVIPFIDRHMNSLIEASREDTNPLLEVGELEVKLGEIRDKPKVTINPQSYRDINIAFFDDDDKRAAVTTRLLTGFGFNLDQFSTIEQLTSSLSENDYSLILVDTDNRTDSREQIYAFAKKAKSLDVDVFMLCSVNTFEARLAAVRAKVDDYLLKPVNITTLVSKIRKHFKIDLVRPYRILLLDDQASVGSFYKKLLENEGIKVLAIDKAESIMSELESFHPDVFLLDMHMPNITGIEVAKLIRQQAKYDYVPIIFLTADDNIETKLEVLECGADDVIHKNTAPRLIAQQIDSRIQRGQEIRYLASRDSLTGVLNHGQIMDAAAHAFRLAARHQKPVTIAMIDLDHFKLVNDQHGHVAGDKVLVSLGQLLLQSVRETDYVGRYGGEEFMIVFSDADAPIIENKINSILNAFKHIEFNADDQRFTSSFSAGIASSKHYQKLSEVVLAADSALYQAKDNGRSQVCKDPD